MFHVPISHRKQLALIAVAVLCAIGAVLVTILYLQSMNNTQEPQESSKKELSHQPTQTLNARSDRLTSREEVDSYLQGVHQATPRLIKEQYVHDTPKVDWKEQDIVAVQFSMYAARTFKGIEIEDVDGMETIVVTTQEPSTNCPSAQVNELNIAFVAVPKNTVDYPLAQRINPTEQTECIK